MRSKPKEPIFDLLSPEGMLAAGRMADERKRRNESTTVTFTKAGRTLSQNNMYYALYTQIASQCEDQSVVDVMRECKLMIGVPIVRSGDREYDDIMNLVLGTLTYEQSLVFITNYAVTRLMSKTQGSDYIDQIIRDYSQRGFSIIHPSELEN